MKTFFLRPFLGLSASALLCCGGCSKQQEPAPSTAEQTPRPAAPAIENAEATAQGAAAEAQKQAAEAKTAADNTLTNAAKTIESVNVPPVPEPPASAQPASSSSVQAVIEKVRTLVAEKKYPEALSALSELSSTTLTAEQQNVVTQLKAQIQNAMAAQAGNEGLKSVGGLLNRKK